MDRTFHTYRGTSCGVCYLLVSLQQVVLRMYLMTNLQVFIILDLDCE
jgi:hypothetical protein